MEESLKSQTDRARLLAVSEPSNSDWLKAFPITSCGLRLSNEVIRIAVGLRLGLPLCVEHTCVCGRQVDRLGTHGLSCLSAEGKTTRHQMINDIIHRSLSAAGVPSIKEPPDTSKLDGKRPDGITIVPWKSGKSLHGTSRSPILMHHHTLTAQCIPRVGRRKQPRKENFRSTPRSRTPVISSQSLSKAWVGYVRLARISCPLSVAASHK